MINILTKTYKVAKRLIIAPYALKRLVKDKPPNTAYILLTHSQIGDNIYALTYLNSLCNRLTFEGKRVNVFALEKRRELVELFKFHSEVIYIKETDKRARDFYFISSDIFCVHKTIKYDIYTSLPWAWDRFRLKLKRNSLEILREMYGLSIEKAELQYPMIKTMTVNSIPNFEIVKNKVVIINPFSLSGKILNESIFCDMADLLKIRGYDVYTNVVGDQKSIEGTKPLNCSIIEFFSICNQIPLVVSIRSGLIDLSISAKCKFYILFPEIHNQAVNNNMYSLIPWNTKNVNEVSINGNNMLVINMFKRFLDNNF